jgi:oligopeptide/dipeptide ABC transporter ATP-binding protein
MPTLDSDSPYTRVKLRGSLPSPSNPPTGCRFHTRCPIARVPGVCSEEEPPLEEKAPGRFAACHFSDEVRTKLPVTTEEAEAAS